MSTATVTATATPAYRILAPAEPASAGVASEFVAAVLIVLGRVALINDARLCVAGMVDDLVQAGREGELTVGVGMRGGGVVVTVAVDGGA
ncbi:hypothetical protein I5Q34_18005 [Streptomyces sp. AV19]|uniref:hypothetical protein n=1 Tax=Streptomyces sp. AV19 TaxID=2793068 RepID=UPI0018FE5A7D|nr:hypothetical protein [Streptomyces sp. AV19]MBH1936141.1 hypothetical protein [Streptomyces sp. AV19]MDG4534063.1 hypothetical protein [Streptomyces sp. AV19]